MDITEKITEGLKAAFQAEQVELDDDDGITGFVVAEVFRGIPSLDRQKMIDQALRGEPAKLSKTEMKRILMIAALTPAEYEYAVSDGGVLSAWRHQAGN